MNQNALLVFYKNPVKGKVKTRLAASVGDDYAFEVYQKLASHTAATVASVTASVIVYYSDETIAVDLWSSDGTKKKVQHGDNLGIRMKNAFEHAFEAGFRKVIIIGSDCLEISSDIINHGFDLLDSADVVIGPAADGGYYLLGMKMVTKDFFENKHWSSSTVFSETVKDCISNNLSYVFLDVLHDIDTEEDLPPALQERKKS